MMTTREYLSQVRRCDRMVANKLAEISNMRLILYGTSAVGNTERVQTSGNKDKICDYVSRITDMEREVDNLIDKRYDIIQQIQSIPDTNAYDALAQKYILGKEIKEIKLDGIESPKHIKRILYGAIETFEKIYGKSYLEVDEMSLNVPK